MADNDEQIDGEFADWQRQLSWRERALEDRLVSPRPGNSPSYWLVTVDEDLQIPKLAQFSTYDQLVEAVRQVKLPAISLPFYGYLFRITETVGDTSLRFLVGPNGDLTPLFSMGNTVRLATSPFFSGDGPKLSPPAIESESLPTASGVVAEDDDEEDSMLDNEASAGVLTGEDDADDEEAATDEAEQPDATLDPQL